MNPATKSGLKYGLVFGMAGILFFLAQVPREEFGLTILLFGLVFGAMLGLFFLTGEKSSFTKILFAGLLLRIAVFLFVPNWSDDFVRFLWDGDLLKMGQNPYSQTPREWQESHPDPENAYQNLLFKNLNSPDYYSVYTPLNQGFFWIGAKAAMGFVWNGFLTIRLILVLGEIGVYILLWRLLETFRLPQKQIYWYWLNPLVVMEIVGNVHFEGLVLMFLLASVLSLSQGRIGFSGGFWGLAAGLKLLPLILGPAFVFASKTKAQKPFWISFFLVVGICFGPLLIGDSFSRFYESLQLYQGKFEFNASVYYVLREIGFWIQGYNIIGDLTKGLSVLTIGLILYFSWKKSPKNDLELVDLFVLIYLIYLILQPVVHPWYILPGLGLSILAGRKTFILWSFGAIFSYQAYGNPENLENPLLLALEYGLVLLGIWMDYFTPKRNPIFEQPNQQNRDDANLQNGL